MAKENDKVKNGFFLGEDEWEKLVEATKECLKQIERPYRWPLHRRDPNESDTVREFTEYSNNLKEYIKNPNCILKKDKEGNPVDPIQQILAWGGIYQKEEINDFKRAVQDLKSESPSDIPTILELGRRETNWRIAAWSKVLAAYQPEIFFIYDSRVAIALSYITLKSSLPSFWAIPNPRSNESRNASENAVKKSDNFKKFKSLCKASRSEKRAAYMPTCYERYLEFLKRMAKEPEICDDYKNRNDNVLNKNIREAYKEAFKSIPEEERETCAIMAHLEKMLFMMKEDIFAKYAKKG